MSTTLRSAVFALLGLALPATTFAQQRPLLTEDPEPIGAGRVLIESGIDFARAQKYPASGLEGKLWRVPTLGLSIGLSTIAELQIDGSVLETLAIDQRRPAPLSSLLTARGTRTSDVGDIVVGTKVRLVPEGIGHPAVTLRVATKLPNASNESGLGLDTTEFYGAILIGKTVQSIRIVANAGFGILPDPVVGHRQNDVVTYGLSLARAVTHQTEFVGEVNGRVSTREAPVFPGTETRGQVGLGARYTRGPVRLDGKVFFGLHGIDPRIGISGGLTYVFDAFRIP
ncbi:MAG: hypothetical protein FJ207_14990 [Gemmatimonadetes bacterium]|nr:hypothetical protein [Gemmatimonadota bacterium]